MIKKSKDELNDMEYLVTKENGTEPKFQNEYWNHIEKGIYVDKLSGKPLFTSEDKFESNCGWPSFSKALNDDEIEETFWQCTGTCWPSLCPRAGLALAGEAGASQWHIHIHGLCLPVRCLAHEKVSCLNCMRENTSNREFLFGMFPSYMFSGSVLQSIFRDLSPLPPLPASIVGTNDQTATS